MNLRSFSLYRNYSYPLTLPNAGEPSWSWIPRDHIQVQREVKFPCCLFTYSIKRHFHVVVVQKRAKKCTKKVWCKCKVVVFLNIKPIVFWRSRRRPRRWILKSLLPESGRRSKHSVYGTNGLEECVGLLQPRLMVHDKIGILHFSGQSGVQLCFPVRRQISLHAQRMQFTKCCYRRYGISLHQHEQLTHWCTVD